MSQNAMRLQWTTEEVDNKLKASSLNKLCLSSGHERLGFENSHHSVLE